MGRSYGQVRRSRTMGAHGVVAAPPLLDRIVIRVGASTEIALRVNVPGAAAGAMAPSATGVPVIDEISSTVRTAVGSVEVAVTVSLPTFLPPATAFQLAALMVTV